MSLAGVTLQRNQTPGQRIARESSCIVVAEGEEEESEEEALQGQSASVKRPSQQDLNQDPGLEEEGE
jgi:hypothetical protein